MRPETSGVADRRAPARRHSHSDYSDPLDSCAGQGRQARPNKPLENRGLLCWIGQTDAPQQTSRNLHGELLCWIGQKDAPQQGDTDVSRMPQNQIRNPLPRQILSAGEGWGGACDPKARVCKKTVTQEYTITANLSLWIPLRD